ncbi:putative tudor domain-containing protein 7 [Trichinella spiralis]|uniref:putative tudor domain-containing protein 7 n=1 Tax=Trichinella spiralis TaxID=6334 RepID=UPI0001EFD171|nr:putative tudor domain-containing protein 7 [Trichinella spiralis]
MDLPTVVKKVHSVLLSFKNGAIEKELLNEFKALTGIDIPFRQHGFRTLDELLCTMPEQVQINNNRGERLYVGMTNAATADLRSLIARQRGKDNYRMNEFRYEVKNAAPKMGPRAQTNVKFVEGKVKQNVPLDNPMRQMARPPAPCQMMAPKMMQKSNNSEMTKTSVQLTKTQSVQPKSVVPDRKENEEKRLICVQPMATPVKMESSSKSTYIIELPKKEKKQYKSVQPFMIQMYGSVKLPYQFRGTVCHVENPSLFFVCSVGLKNLFYDDFSCKMANDFRMNSSVSEGDIIPGRLYIVGADISAMGYAHYTHRGLCLEKPKDDFGCIIPIEVKSVRMLKHSYASISPLVMACSIFGVKSSSPNDMNEYPADAIEYFNSLVWKNDFTIVVKKKTTYKNKLGMDMQLLCVDMVNTVTGVNVQENMLRERISVLQI